MTRLAAVLGLLVAVCMAWLTGAPLGPWAGALWALSIFRLNFKSMTTNRADLAVA